MKRCIYFLFLTLLFFTSCQKNLKKNTGDYSYKVSGKVDFRDAEGNTAFILMNERGQMNILEDRKGGKGAVIFTFNEMNGSAYSCTGRVKGDSIFIDRHEFVTRFSSADSVPDLILLGCVFAVQAEGKGVINNNMIIINEKWTGYREDGTQTTLKSDKIALIAEANKK